MCKAHSKVTHIKQQKYFHHLKRPAPWRLDIMQSSYYIHGPLSDENMFTVLCVTLLLALHIVIKQQFLPAIR